MSRKPVSPLIALATRQVGKPWSFIRLRHGEVAEVGFTSLEESRPAQLGGRKGETHAGRDVRDPE